MNDKGFESMNVIPLVDVMLVLLTIVLTTSTFIASGVIPVDLPQTEKASTKKEHRDRQIIEINREGEIFCAAKKVSLDELKKVIATFPEDAEVLIRADRQVSLQAFVSVLDAVKKQGLQQVLLQTEESI